MRGMISKCRACNGEELRPFFDLGAQPFANSLLPSPDAPERAHPLSLSWCSQCNLVQLDYTADPKELFSHYVWVTGTSEVAKRYAEEFCDRVLACAGDIGDGYVLEIAHNDGTFLAPFKKKGHRVLGVDPAENVVRMAEASGIPSKCAFWRTEEAKKLAEEHGPAHVIFARNVLPHVAHTRDFVEGIALALADEGVCAIEAHYAPIILSDLHYDSIYHEHLCYFTFKSLERLLNEFGLFVFDVTESPISGGSIVVYARKQKAKESERVSHYRSRENETHVNDYEVWKKFADRSVEHKNKFVELLNDYVRAGKVVVGWGASARSSTLLNFCRITPHTVSVIADKNPLKQGKYTAGTHIPIVSPEIALQKNPAAVAILGWNFAEEIKKELRERFNFRGDCIIPLPNAPRVEKA